VGSGIIHVVVTWPRRAPGSRGAERWPHIPGAKTVAVPERSRRQIADELMKTSASLRLPGSPEPPAPDGLRQETGSVGSSMNEL
jgi:hypothetical protein